MVEKFVDWRNSNRFGGHPSPKDSPTDLRRPIGTTAIIDPLFFESSMPLSSPSQYLLVVTDHKSSYHRCGGPFLQLAPATSFSSKPLPRARAPPSLEWSAPRHQQPHLWLSATRSGNNAAKQQPQRYNSLNRSKVGSVYPPIHWAKKRQHKGWHQQERGWSKNQ